MSKSFFQTSSALKAKHATAEDRREYLFPPIQGYCDKGIPADHKHTMQTLRNIAKECNDTLPSNVDDEGISSPNAVPGNFNALHTVSGYATDLYIPMADNRKQRQDLKLSSDFESTRDKQIFSELVRVMFGSWKFSAPQIARDSSTCFPFFIKQVDFKHRQFERVARNWPAISKQLMAGDLVGMFNDHDAIINQFIGVRTQPDKVSVDEYGNHVSKDRWIWDLDYALSSGAKGQTWPADKTIILNDKVLESNFRMRKRVVFGTPGWMNYFLNAIFSGFREHYLKEYEFTWKHRTAPEIKTKIEKFTHFLGFDVHQYDSTFDEFMFNAWLEEMTNYVTPEVVELMRMALHSPYYQASVKRGCNEQYQIGDPMNPDHFRFNYGLPSGIPPNPDLGKLMMTFNLLVLIDRYFHDVLEFGVEPILKGDHPLYGLLNMGDDSIILLNDTQVTSKMKQMIAEDDWPARYFKMEKEASISFLGNVFHRDDHGDLQLSPNIISMAVNWFVPEMGTTHPRRKYWGIGWEERNKYYMSAPGFQKVWDIINRNMSDEFDVLPDYYAKRGKEMAGDPNLGHLTEIDRVVLDDPSKLHYRFQTSDLSANVAESLCTTLDASIMEEYIVPLITKSIIK